MDENTVRKAIGYGAAIVLIFMILAEFLISSLHIQHSRAWILFLLVAGFLDFIRKEVWRRK